MAFSILAEQITVVIQSICYQKKKKKRWEKEANLVESDYNEKLTVDISNIKNSITNTVLQFWLSVYFSVASKIVSKIDE